KAGGAEFTDEPELLSEMRREGYDPERVESYERGGGREVLFTGRVVPGAVESLTTRSVRYLGQGLSIFGAAMSAYDVGKAAGTGIKTQSVQPLIKEGARQAGLWAGA